MSDFNMPPGVSTNDLPGNRPEDLENEAFWETLDKRFIEIHGDKGKKWLTLLEDIDPDDLIFEYVTEARMIAYDKGYSDARRDDALAEQMREPDE